jgi:hypothetical protein
VRDRLGRQGRYSSKAAATMWRDVAYWPLKRQFTSAPLVLIQSSGGGVRFSLETNIESTKRLGSAPVASGFRPRHRRKKPGLGPGFVHSQRPDSMIQVLVI